MPVAVGKHGGRDLPSPGIDDDPATIDGERSERGDDRWDAEEGNQQAVAGAQRESDAAADQEHEDQRTVGLAPASLPK